MGEQFLEGLRSWLDKSGHALEMRTAQAFREGGAKPVVLSFAYTDVNTGMLREGDVLASFGWAATQAVPTSIQAVIECKGPAGHPWVGFFDHRMATGSHLEDWVHFAHGPFTTVIEPLGELWIGLPPFDARQVASNLVAAHVKDGRNPAGDALRQVISSSHGLRQRYIDRQGRDQVGLVLLPVIVTAERLVEARLDTTGEIALQEVSSMVVAAPRAEGSTTRVYVLTEAAVPAFARALADRAIDAGREASTAN